MAKILSNAGIVTGLPVEAKHVSQSVNALTGAEAYDIIISGSLIVNGLTYPYIDGTANQSLLTDGAGNITIRTLETVPTASFVSSSNVYGPYGFDSIQTASYSLTSSYAIFANLASSSLFSINSQNANTATSSSYALTASYALNGGGGGSGSFATTASYALTASYIEMADAYRQNISESIATITHNRDSEDVLVAVYKATGVANPELIIPSSVILTDTNTAVVSFSNIVEGYVIVTDGKGVANSQDTASYAITASYALNGGGGDSISSSYALTASHALNVGNSNDAYVSSVISSNIITFTKGDGSQVTNTITTASYAPLSLTASYAETASYLLGSIESASYSLFAESTKTISYPAYNDDNVTITAGTPLYVTEVDGNNYNVRRADAADINKMPAVGVASTTVVAGGMTELLIIGEVKNQNTFGLNVGKNIYVASGGGYTQTKPLAPALIQPIGIIGEVDFTEGRLLINGPMADMSSGSASVSTASYVSSSNVDGPYGFDSVLTSSYALTASYALNGGGGGSNNSYREAVTGNTSYTITHNLNETFPIVQAYEQISLSQEIPSSVTSTGVNTISVSFINNFDGTIVVIK